MGEEEASASGLVECSLEDIARSVADIAGVGLGAEVRSSLLVLVEPESLFAGLASD